MSAWDDLPVVGPIGHGAPDWCSVHGDIPGDMSIVAHINATHDMTYEEYRALDQMRADRTGFDSFDDARRFKTGEVAIPAPDERQAGLLDRQIEEFMGWLFRDGGAEPPRREYDAVEQRLRLLVHPLDDASGLALALRDWMATTPEDRQVEDDLRDAAEAWLSVRDDLGLRP